MKTAEYWIEKLHLQAHPEGGYFQETYRSIETIRSDHLPQRFGSDRSFSTAIYYLLKGGQFSAFHRLKSDEIWHFYDGSSLTINTIHQSGIFGLWKLGPNLEFGERFQVTIPATVWLAARCNDEKDYSLVGCTVAPGFDFNDLEFAKRQDLINNYPNYTEYINRLTHR